MYYEGGHGIDRFRGELGTDGPEDWVGSVTPFPELLLPAGADPKTGISALGDGTLLDGHVSADPEGWLGPELHRSFGSEPGLLVKLLDAGGRLPVHWHPDRAFAKAHLASRFGKNEGWIVLAARADARIWLGFAREVGAGELKAWVDTQDAEAMLAAMNVFTPAPGDVYYVPAGVPHAIGAGVTIVELQEPTSFSILAEYRSFGVDEAAATLGLGWELALSCVDARAYADELLGVLRPAKPRRPPGGRDALPPLQRGHGAVLPGLPRVCDERYGRARRARLPGGRGRVRRGSSDRAGRMPARAWRRDVACSVRRRRARGSKARSLRSSAARRASPARRRRRCGRPRRAPSQRSPR